MVESLVLFLKYRVYEGIGRVSANGIVRYALVVAHVLPFEFGNQQITAGQNLEALVLHNLLVLIVAPGDLGMGTGVHLAGQHYFGSHQIQMCLLVVDDAWLLCTRVLFLGHDHTAQTLIGVRRMHCGAGENGLGAGSTNACVDPWLTQHMINNMH